LRAVVPPETPLDATVLGARAPSSDAAIDRDATDALNDSGRARSCVARTR
jgi:hypothetical protein